MGIDEQELAQARANRRELAWVTQRIADVRAERERVAGQLAVYEKARDYEQADVDSITRGVGRFFRTVVGSTELTDEHQKLAAAQLLCDEMADELHALDVELAHLEKRAAAVANAEQQYTELLRDLEAVARGRGQWNEELSALAASEAELEANRHELAEIIAAAIEVQQTMMEIVALVREIEPSRSDTDAPVGIVANALFEAITGHTSSTYTDLCRAVACAQQGLRALDRSWKHVTTPTLEGPPSISVELPSVGRAIAREIFWSNAPTLDALLAQVSSASSKLVWRVSELRERDAALARALAECSRMRARILDPHGEPDAAPYR